MRGGKDETAAGSCGEDDEKEWVAQVEPGVLISFLSLPQGGNYLKRIRFRWTLAHPFQSLHLGSLVEQLGRPSQKKIAEQENFCSSYFLCMFNLILAQMKNVFAFL
jgi:hypothetical protein